MAIYEVIYDKKVDFHTTTSCVAPVSSPRLSRYPRNKRRRGLSFELHRSEVLSKRSQVPIFLRSEEEGRGRGRRGREGRQVEVEKSRNVL